MPEDERIQPNTNICHLPTGVFQRVYQHIQIAPGILQRLIACGDGTKYQLSDIRRYEVLGEGTNMNHMIPAERLLTIWGNLGMTVQHLAAALKMLRVERPLLLLIDREPLVLEDDIPAKLEVEEGGILRLQCKAQGFPFPKYCWYQAKELRVQNTSGVLEIQNVGLNDTGPYVCRIHNSYQNQKEYLWTSWCHVQVTERLTPVQPTTGTVAAPTGVEFPKSPHILRQPVEELRVENGKTLHLSVEACGAGTLIYTWCHNNSICQEPSTRNVLTIPQVEPKHKGKYQCTISNQHDDIKSAVCEVDVMIPGAVSADDKPHILREPTDKQECIGGEALFVVEARSSKKLRYQWYHNSAEMAGECKAELRIEIKSKAQSGLYQCTVSTDSGSKVTRQAKLDILRRPKTFHYFATDKVALIFGQSSYRANFKPLPAVKNDIYEAYSVFTDLGFKTLSFLDNTLQEMNRAVNMLCDFMQGEGNTKLYVVLYFLGHGFMYQENHYLMPHDALEGTQVSSCLCIEEVEKQIEKELHPELLFMVLDTCKKKQKNVMPETLPPSLESPVCKKRFVFYAASCGEESCEEQVQEISNGGRVKSTKHKVRGIFSRDLLGVIKDNHKLRIIEIYQTFTDAFDRPDPKIDHKIQNPECRMSLEEYDRSLSDPIFNDGHDEEYIKRLNKWRKLNVVPAKQIIYIEQHVWYLETEWKQRGSNILEVTIREVDKRVSGSLPNKQVSFTLQEDSVPPVVKPPEEIPEEGKQKRYVLFNLQRLESELKLVWQLQMKAGCWEATYEASQNYGLPLIAQIWNVSPPQVVSEGASVSPYLSCPDDSSMASYQPSPESKVACEHLDDFGPNSMESSC